jgi:PPOX class probable F420-dependent enzyme
MTYGACRGLAELPSEPRAILTEARRGVLSTIAADGSPHSVPVVYVVTDEDIVSPIDDKPKEGVTLARVRNLERDPRATLLADRWTEEWTRLGWVMVRASVAIVEPNPAEESLRALYPQYTGEITPGDRALVLRPHRISWWTWSDQ